MNYLDLKTCFKAIILPVLEFKSALHTQKASLCVRSTLVRPVIEQWNIMKDSSSALCSPVREKGIQILDPHIKMVLWTIA